MGVVSRLDPGSVPFIALDRAHAAIRDELNAAFARLLRSSAFTLGEEVEAFEAEFGSYCNADHCVGVASGAAALALTLQAAGIGPGDEVIVPAHTFISSALAVVHAGATPVLCDVLDGTGLIDPNAARAAVGPRTAAIVPVHLYGQACDMDAINEVAAPRGLFVLEDAAQAHGARYRDRLAGSLGGAAAFSFYPTKNLGALGEAGAVCTDDSVLAARVRRLRHLGQRAKGEHVEIGYNERLDGLQAALLRVKLAHLEEWNAARRGIAARYRELLSGVPGVKLLEDRPESPCIYHLFPTRFEERDAVAGALRAHWVETAVHYSPALHGHPALRDRRAPGGPFPVAEAWAAEELSLPMHSHLRSDEIEWVARAVEGALAAPPLRSHS
jgi:dTDP-3-amino-3,4,6-trideoxy-alpha-D-glucose transaminase